MKAIWRGHVIAESHRTLVVNGDVYFPRETVCMEMLRSSPKTARDLACPHGVQFYAVVNGRESSKRAAWSYEAPLVSMESVDHWIGFWEDIEFV